MKIIFALTGLFALNAAASYTVRPIAYSPPLANHSWFCMADGYDYAGNRRSISGADKPTRTEAARDAIRACQGIFMTCQVGTCIQER